jgi:hypothetical protein
VSLRARVNSALTKTTGYRLVRADPAPAPAPKPKAARATPDPEALARRRAAAQEKRRDAKLPKDYDPQTQEIWRAVSHRTMTHHNKIQFLVEAVRYVERHQVPGAIVECGVWRGGSMLAVARTLLQLGVTDRDLYLFDTFTGMPEPTDRDVRINEGKHADEFLHATGSGPMAWSRPDRFIATLDDVQAGFAEVDYPDERIHFVSGKVEETVPDEAPDQIAILRLDTDWYASTKHELAHLYSRLAPGGVLILDDYGTWQGSKEATDEFLDETGEPLLLTRVHRSRVAVKPGLSSRT